MKKAKKAPSYLFVLQAKKGTITKTDKKGVYTLTFKHSDMGPAITFTDRPNRIVKTITPEQLKNMWKQGTNSFEEDPPNAVLTAQGMNAEIIELTSITVDSRGVALVVTELDDSSGEIGGRLLLFPSLTIDDMKCGVRCGPRNCEDAECQDCWDGCC